jgi:protocatechuate 3,4-dioxygenase beta subunit
MEARVINPMRRPTEEQVEGPFYPVVKPPDQDADLTVIQGKEGKAQGQVIYVFGQVLNLKGEPIPGVQVEIWQANTFGRYTHPTDANPAPLDPNFEGYGCVTTDASGRYKFKTVKPGAYPISHGWRTPHIHFCLTSNIKQLVTQLYFDGESLNEQDPLLKNVRNKESVMTQLAPPSGDMEPESMAAAWDIVLGQM